MADDIIYREAKLSDLPGIFEIYNYEILNSTSTFDQEPKSLKEQDEFFNLHNREVYPIFVAEMNGKIVGWARLFPFSPRTAYNRTAEVSMYVELNQRRFGIGKILFQMLIDHCPKVGIKVLLSKISDENQGSVAYHKRFGFKTVGIMKEVGEKFGRLLDVRIMELHL